MESTRRKPVGTGRQRRRMAGSGRPVLGAPGGGSLRSASWRLIVGFLAAHAVWTTAVNLGFRARVPYLGTLSANGAGLLLLIVGLLFVVGRLRPRDVGLVARDVPAGVAFTVAAFVLVEAGTLFVAVLDPGVTVVNRWATQGVAVTSSLLVAQLLGNALYEEVAFRGFLLPQLFLTFRRLGVAVAFVLAPAASQLLFALAHVPNRLWVTGLAPRELPGSLLPLFVMGLWFALLYLLTDNLFAVVGVHALVNVPMSSLVGVEGHGLDAPVAAIHLAVSLLLAGPWWWGRYRSERARARPPGEPAIERSALGRPSLVEADPEA